MSGQRRSIGDVAWDLAWWHVAALMLARSLAGNWPDAFRWVVLGILVTSIAGAWDEWRDELPRWVAERRKRRAER